MMCESDQKNRRKLKVKVETNVQNILCVSLTSQLVMQCQL